HGCGSHDHSSTAASYVVAGSNDSDRITSGLCCRIGIRIDCCTVDRAEFSGAWRTGVCEEHVWVCILARQPRAIIWNGQDSVTSIGARRDVERIGVAGARALALAYAAS